MRQPLHITVPFPSLGLNLSYASWQQPQSTTADCLNVRAFDPLSGRNRGGQRNGLKKHCPDLVSGANRVQDINSATTVQTGATASTALNIRTVVGCAVADGDVAKFTSSAVTAATSGTNALSATAPVIFSAELFGVLYFADGTNEKKWTASTNTVAAWAASAGTMPDGGSGEKPRLIETWNGRIVLSGIENDPHNWFMSAVGDATDFDYSPDPETETQAVAGNNSTAGKVGDVINTMIPFNDDILIFGCDHSIWQMTGDPAAGGRIDRISDATGMSWGRPWCKDPNGVIYFFGSRGGVFRMTPGSPPQRLTQTSIEYEISRVDLNSNIVRLAWNDEDLGVHVLISPLDGNGGAYSYFFDARNEAWFRDEYPADYQSAAVFVIDGDDPDDRAVLLGGEDGYLRKFDRSVASDDGTAIESYVWIGPFQVEEGRLPFVLSEIRFCLGSNSGSLSYDVYGFDCAEGLANIIEILAQENNDEILAEDGTSFLLTEAVVGSFTLNSGNTVQAEAKTDNPRVRARSLYIKLYNTANNETWSLEWVQMALSTVVTSRRRRM